jgi:Trk K+ transport system NAD-binding subunit
MRLILIGAGGVSRELLRRLGDMWEVTVVDPSSDLLARAGYLRSVQKVIGDGSSRVVLQRAGLERADAFIAASEDDEVNLEACRIARTQGVLRVAAVADDPERVADYRELGVAAESPDSLAARRLELGLESRRISSMAFADGKAEAIEFLLEPDSPVRGKALEELAAENWIVGAVLRRGELIVPHGDTVLEESDSVTVVGKSTAFTDIVRTFAGGESRFPLDYGKRVAVYAEREPREDGIVAEALHLVRNSAASALVVVHEDLGDVRDETRADATREALARAERMADGVEVRRRALTGKPVEALASVPQRESVGVVVVPARERGRLRRYLHVRRGLGLVRQLQRPVLLARGSHPYRRILVPARRTHTGRAGARVSIDLARYSKARLVGVHVVDPEFLAGGDAQEDARHCAAWLEEEAAIHGVNVEARIEQGNVVRQIVGHANDVDLLVLAVPPRSRVGSFSVDVTASIARRFPKSVLLAPVGLSGAER